MPSQEARIRRCREQDLPAVLDLWKEGRSEHASTPDRVEDLELLIGGSSALLVAERDGAILGTLIAAWDGWRGNMYRLTVRADCRRQGIGLRLTRAGEEHLRGQGARRITALVAYDAEAGRFWDAAGYPADEQIGRRVRNV